MYPRQKESRRGTHSAQAETGGVERLRDLGPDAFEQFSDLEATRLLSHLLGALTDKQEAVIILRYRDELTFEEIAERLGIATMPAHRLHERATKALKARLAAMRIFRLSDLI